ncbi:hypothetical protein SLS55_005139 [Diplodia seriata]|uniref:Response regulatory domain-containing protein n=1 Tax=Diplodia seriata TaxID=420778 RepID=A0ABR3CFI5_9PEZI
MPRVRALQGDGSLAGHVPIIAVTANARSEQISAALDAGMDLVITKPFRIPELLPQMDALLGRMAERKREQQQGKGEGGGGHGGAKGGEDGGGGSKVDSGGG